MSRRSGRLIQISNQGIFMKKIVIAAALLVLGSSAHAGTYNVA
ncbi:hypothetical protein [Bradyrhizobium canariense]|nr:hypothetical protein [Bradyrhizobium canariense]